MTEQAMAIFNQYQDGLITPDECIMKLIALIGEQGK